MNTTIKQLLEHIEELNEKLNKEYAKQRARQGFNIIKKRIVFLKATKKKHRRLRMPSWRYAIPTNIKHILSTPFIYGMIIPLVLLDLTVSTYQAVAFHLYGIPRVRRSTYLNNDRKYLSYLNTIQKVNCLYCSYANGLMAYAQEITARTERYWCPIKAAQQQSYYHNWYKYFADYGDAEGWNKKFNHLDDFAPLLKKTTNKHNDPTKKKTPTNKKRTTLK